MRLYSVDAGQPRGRLPLARRRAPGAGAHGASRVRAALRVGGARCPPARGGHGRRGRGRRRPGAGTLLEYRSARHRALPAAHGDARPPRARPPRTLVRARMLRETADDELDRFLTARWGFHETRRGRTIWARNTHVPWPLRRAELLDLDDELLAAAGFPGLSTRPPDSVLASPGCGHPLQRAHAD